MVRVEVELLLRSLAARDLTMTPLTDPPPYRPNLIVRGIQELRVQLHETTKSGLALKSGPVLKASTDA
jgi:hypothetical protein